MYWGLQQINGYYSFFFFKCPIWGWGHYKLWVSRNLRGGGVSLWGAYGTEPKSGCSGEQRTTSPGESRLKNLGVSVGIVVTGQIQPQSWEGLARGQGTGGRTGNCFVWRRGWARLYDVMASFDGLPPPGVLDYDGLDPKPGGYMWSRADILECNYIMFRGPWKGGLKNKFN